MRTTVEMKREHRDALLALAARRGERGFSKILAEAVGEYLVRHAERQRRLKDFLAIEGSLSTKEANDLRRNVKWLRRHWR